MSFTFKTPFVGSRNVFLYALDTSGRSDGWTALGSWSVLIGGPSVVSVTPSSGTGLATTFSAVYRHPSGFAQLNQVQLLITGDSGRWACWAYYAPQSNSFWLINDMQTGVLGPLAAGSNASLQNSQCTINGSGSVASGSGTDLIVRMSINFKPAFVGFKYLLLYALDVAGQGVGWTSLGSWTLAN
jgi:hypothetical protein